MCRCHTDCRVGPGAVSAFATAMLLGWGLLFAAEPVPAADADAPPRADLSAATRAAIERLRELRAGLADEDPPTRDRAAADLRAEMEAILESLFRVPPDEDTPDERRLLAQLAAQLRAKVEYEQFLLKIPAAQRNSVDAMLKKSGGPDFQRFFDSSPAERGEWIDKLVAGKPDPEVLALFFCTLLNDKDPNFVTKLLTVALEASPQVAGQRQVSTAYLEPVGDLLKKGYIEQYIGKANDVEALQMMQMRIMNREGGRHDVQAWHQAAVQLLLAIPGERANTMLLQLLKSLAAPEQMQLQMQMGQDGSGLLLELGEALVGRKMQAAFPILLKPLPAFAALQMGASFNGGPTLYTSPCDSLVYLAYRLIDPNQPKREARQYGGLGWKSNAERLKFYDGFIAAWQNVVKDPHREGYAVFEKWYQENRPQLVQAVDQEDKVLQQQGLKPGE